MIRRTGQVTVRTMVLEINKEAFHATMGRGEYPIYKSRPVIHAFSKAGKLFIMTKNGEVIGCEIDDVTVSW